ncbi:DEAD/DEAH box helicase [Rugosimonospora acidiphila]|uniref:DEAD/DEAH box helicase n=1 Tax=Rugosimonospora acidiphila TaxID=556531 RepID=A0ABP9RIX4_9ACTN
MTSPTLSPAGSLAPDELLDRLLAGQTEPLTHVERVPARDGVAAPWPEWVTPALRSVLAERGITAPWTHQAVAADLAHSGRHVVVSTGTGSGKSLAYHLPVLATLQSDPRATALYLAPSKALAADQLTTLTALASADVRPALYDGDTPREERDWVRAYARFVLTNPDMLHYSVLPRHDGWSTFLRRLRYVVVDECHAYRGVFGSHVAQVLRRLRRICARYGSAPVFVLASATAGDPAEAASRLVGLPVTAVTEDGSPRGGVTFALWEPPLLSTGPGRGTVPDGPSQTGRRVSSTSDQPSEPAEVRVRDAMPIRRSALRETADLLADSVAGGVRTLAFVRSRRGAEVVAAMARRSLAEAVPELADRVAAYRAGYLREERRALERALRSGELYGLASTNALELGVDLVGLDAVVIAGYPGTLASLWQQAGRAGRAGRDALCVLVARDDPLDTYLVHHPEALFGRSVEATVLDPGNPYVLGPHLCCAAAELPLTDSDLVLFGEAAPATVDALVSAGALRRRPSGWYWTDSQRPEVDLRGTGGARVSIVESSTGRLLGTVDGASSHAQVHSGAVHLHQGASYIVDELDLEDSVALVHAEEPDWTTHPRDVTNVDVVSVSSYLDAGPVGLFLGTVDVTGQVVGYQRRRISTGEVIDTRPLDLPVRQLRTTAVWWTISPDELDRCGVEPPDIPGALHAAEHAAIGLLPLVATCDRWDIGGLSTAAHPDTEAPTVFVYDGHPGGAGFAERAYHAAAQWLHATRDVIDSCGCEAGCPSCVQSPKCGNGNDPLNKADAVRVLDAVLASLPPDDALTTMNAPATANAPMPANVPTAERAQEVPAPRGAASA